MQHIKDVVSPWRGSEKTADEVREQIRARFGEEAADEFDPSTDAMPFSSWLAQGFAVKKGSKALQSNTIIEVKDPDDETKTKKVRRVVNLFHKRQVMPLKNV